MQGGKGVQGCGQGDVIEQATIVKDLKEVREPDVLLPGEQGVSKEKSMFKFLKWEEA